LQNRQEFTYRKMLIFTGPIDEFFNFELGRLTYRGQRREHEFVSHCDFLQPCGQVNNPDPDNGSHIRTLEWKHMMPPEEAAAIRGTLVTREHPITPDQPDQCEYPFPNASNTALYEKYRERAASIPDLLICGRLGEYRYYDMDQAIARATLLARRILDGVQ
jgi:UDP-galactopyranose mutase